MCVMSSGLIKCVHKRSLHGWIIFLFLQAVDVNKEIDGRNPIHYAADYGQYDVINYLISKGADVNVCTYRYHHQIYIITIKQKTLPINRLYILF